MIVARVWMLVIALASPVFGSLYEDGMEARRRADLPAARAAFERLLKEDPGSGGGLEGLALVNLAEGRYEEALELLERWQKKGDSAYIQSLKARAYDKLGRRRERGEAIVAQATLDPADVVAGRRADSYLRESSRAMMPYGGLYKSLSQEGLETGSPQRIVYQGRSGGATARFPARGGLVGFSGAAFRQEAQRNDTRGFTYYDILEQTYTVGAEAKGDRGQVAGQYGQSALSDNKAGAAGVGRLNFSRVKLWGSSEAGGFELRGALERSPYYLRGAGGSRFFALLREISGRAEAEGYLWTVVWLARLGFSDYSENTTTRHWSLLATKETGPVLLQPSYSRGFHEFYGAGPTGRVTVMPLDRWAARARTGEEGSWQAWGSYGHSIYRDGNRLNDGSAQARVWVPGVSRLGGLWGSYRFEIADFRVPVEGYRSSDARVHWMGAFWRRQWRRGPWTQVGYEHGYFNDARGVYEGNAWNLELEWYRKRDLSLTAQAQLGNTSVRDERYSAALQARWTF